VLDEVSVTRSATSHETSLPYVAPDSIKSADLQASRSWPGPQDWGAFQGRRLINSASPAVDLALQHGFGGQPHGLPKPFSEILGGYPSSRSQSPWPRTQSPSQLYPSGPFTPDTTPPTLLQACALEPSLSPSLGDIALAGSAMDAEAMGTGTDCLPGSPQEAVLMAVGASYACASHRFSAVVLRFS
jgi:hypothetical protein